MAKHAGLPRQLLLGCTLLSLSLTAPAQDKEPDKQPDTAPARGLFLMPAEPTAPAKDGDASSKEQPTRNMLFGSFSSGDSKAFEEILKQQAERQTKLRQQLADPEQRKQIMAERIGQQRQLHQDLGRVLKLDVRTEEKLIALLADQQLTAELQPRTPFTSMSSRISKPGTLPENPMRADAERYTQRMQEIGKLIGNARLDQFVDYDRSFVYRNLVAQFDAQLPAEHKLDPLQRDALTTLLQEHSDTTSRSFRVLRRFPSLRLPSSQEDFERQNIISNIVINEQSLAPTEAANRELVQKAGSLLTPEQSQGLAEWKDKQLEGQRAYVRMMRRQAGVGPDEKLEVPEDEAPASSPPLSKDLLLTIEITVNDIPVVKQLTSKRGSTVSFEAPEGLLIEVRPYLEQQILMSEVKLSEKVRGGRRVVGQVASGTELVDPGAKQPLQFGGSGGSLAQGRKGYAFSYSVKAQYL